MMDISQYTAINMRTKEIILYGYSFMDFYNEALRLSNDINSKETIHSDKSLIINYVIPSPLNQHFSAIHYINYGNRFAVDIKVEIEIMLAPTKDDSLPNRTIYLFSQIIQNNHVILPQSVISQPVLLDMYAKNAQIQRDDMIDSYLLL